MTQPSAAKPAPAPKAPRILVIANKTWEADPLVNVLLSDRTRPATLKDFAAVNHPLIRAPGYADPDPPAKPRITFTCGKALVEVWCIQDLMNPKVSGSSSAEKARVLPRALIGDAPVLVIAFGTAGFPDTANLNGSVVIGSRCLVHDPPTKETTRFTPKLKDTVSSTTLSPAFFRNIDADVRFPAEARFLSPPIEPARPPIILAGHNWIALGSVNVMNYDDYVWTDAETIAMFKGLDAKTTAGRIGSMETTHGIIRELSDPAKFLFVSGITDTVPYFDIQVTPRVYAQNFVAAHNAGVALAWLIPEVVVQLGLGS
jgi:hypothetical protein